MNDSRMNVSIALTAAVNGAAVGNHIEVLSLLKNNNNVVGATVRDTISGEQWDIKANVVINATGPFSGISYRSRPQTNITLDNIRQMEDPTTPNIIAPSAGVHVLPDDSKSINL